MRIPTKTAKGVRGGRGMMLLESLWLTLLLVWFAAGAHIAVVKYWNRKLDDLQSERLRYDGLKEKYHN
jgi:hypothetical protein